MIITFLWLNGLVTDATFMSQYVAGFTAKPVQSIRGYFPLYDLSIAINKAFEMEQSELKVALINSTGE